MDPTFSNQAIRMTIEFGDSPRTPPSASRRAHTSNDIPSSPLATSPRKRDRLLETLRFKSKRDVSPSKESIDERSPSRRRSIVDLFQAPSLRSRINPESEVNPKASPIRRVKSTSPKKESTVSDEMTMPEVHPPKRRKSLGDLMGSLSMRGKYRKGVQTPVEAPPSPLYVLENDICATEAKAIGLDRDSDVIISVIALPEGSGSSNAGDMDTRFEQGFDTTRQARMDPIREDSGSPASSAHSWSSGEATIGSRRAICSASDDGEERRRSHTPDSYLRLLIEAASPPCRDPTPTGSCKEVSLSPSPYKFQAIQPVDFLEYQSSYEGIEQPSKSAESSADEFASLEPGICVCPEGLTFESSSLRDQRPFVTVQEVDPSHELTDLDISFRERMDDLNERHLQLHLDTIKNFDAIKESYPSGISDEQYKEQRIKSTVAKMTQNYRFVSSFEDCWPEFPAESSKSVRFDLSPGKEFEQDQADVVDSIIQGSKIFQKCAPYNNPKTMPSSNSLRTEALAYDLFGPSCESSSSISKHDSVCAFDEERTSTAEFPPIGLPAMPLDERYPTNLAMLLDSNNYPGFDLSLERNPAIQRCEALGAFSLDSEQTASTQGEVSVQFPGTMNLHSHIEKFDSMSEAFSALFDYKLSDLSNFCTYDPKGKVIFAHSLDYPVPNPADLQDKDFQLIWLPMLQVVPPTMPRTEISEADLSLMNPVPLQAPEELMEASVVEENLDIDFMPSPGSSILGEENYVGIDQDAYDDTGSEHEQDSLFFDDSISLDFNRAMNHLLESHISEAGLPSHTDHGQEASDPRAQNIRHGNATPSPMGGDSVEGHRNDFNLGLERRYRAMHSIDSSEASEDEDEDEDEDHYSMANDDNLLLSDEEVRRLRAIAADFIMPDVSQIGGDSEPDDSFNYGGISADGSSRLSSREGSVDPVQSIEGASENKISPNNLRKQAQGRSESTMDVVISISGAESHWTPKKRCVSIESIMSVRPGFRVPAPKRTTRYQGRLRRHRGRSHSADSVTLKNLYFEESEAMHLGRAPRLSSQGFRAGFNFTAFADQLAGSSDSDIDADEEIRGRATAKETRKAKSSLRMPLASPSLTKLSVSLRERSQSPKRKFELFDSEREPTSNGKGSSRGIRGLLEHQVRREAEGSPLQKLAPGDLDNMNIRLIGKAARGMTSPKVGALVEIFQARGMIPPSLKPGLHKTPSPISIGKKELGLQPSQEPVVPGDIWSAFVE